MTSLETAGRYLAEAGKDFDVGSDMSAILTAYSCMFHAGRAILFMDGVQERSHKAICEYLKLKHNDLGVTYVNTFDTYRELRHAVAYGIDTITRKEDSKKAINSAASFLERVKGYLKF